MPKLSPSIVQKNICVELNNLGQIINEWLTEQPEVKEESLTDWFLYQLSRRIPGIKYKQFTRSEEGRKTGADWEWWFVFSNTRSFGCRVQAKKLKSKVDNYPGIAYVSNDRLQIERLLDDASQLDLAAFYAFYTSESNKGKCQAKINGNGVFISDANRLHELFFLRKKRKLFATHVLRHSNSLSCLFCCPLILADTKEIENGFRKYLKTYFPLFAKHSKDFNEEIGFQETPNHILKACDFEFIPEDWGTQFRVYFEGVSAVLIVDMRGN